MAINVETFLHGAKQPFEVARKTLRGILYGTDTMDILTKYRWPEDISYKLKNCGDELDKRDIRILGQAGFIDHAFYLASKALDSRPEEQLKLLSNAAQAVNRQERNFLGIISEAVEEIPDDTRISGAKLRVIGPMGVEALTNRFEGFAANVIEQGKTPVLVAYSGLLGYRRLVGMCGGNVDLYVAKVISPDNTNSDIYGFKVNLDGQVDFLRKDTPRPEKAVLFDDIYNTGRRIGIVNDFWVNAKGMSGARLEYMCGFTSSPSS